MGSESVLALRVGNMALSQRLYAESARVGQVVQGLVARHAAGFQSARDLTLQIYEGYGFRRDEPLKISPRNPRLPRYLREDLLTDQTLLGDLRRHFARVQAATLKTPALRAAYLEAIDALRKGPGDAYLARKLDVGSREKLQQVLNGADPVELLNAKRDPLYRVKRVGEVDGRNWPVDTPAFMSGKGRMAGMKSEQIALQFCDMTPMQLNPAQSKARDYVVERGIATDHEHGIALNRGGFEVARFTSSLRDYLKIPEEFPTGDIVEIHHNHPIGDSLSRADLSLLLTRRDVSAVFVHGHHGAAYSAVKRASSTSGHVSHTANIATMKTAEAVDRGIISHADSSTGIKFVVAAILLERDGLIAYTVNSASVRALAERIADL